LSILLPHSFTPIIHLLPQNYNISIDIIHHFIYNIFIDLQRRDKMKPIGAVRKIDYLGRLNLPTGLRRELKINIGDPLEIFIDGALVLLKKHEPVCIFCGEKKDVEVHKNKNVCKKCMGELRK